MDKRKTIFLTAQIFTSLVGAVCLLSSLFGIEHMIGKMEIVSGITVSLFAALSFTKPFTKQ